VLPTTRPSVGVLPGPCINGRHSLDGVPVPDVEPFELVLAERVQHARGLHDLAVDAERTGATLGMVEAGTERFEHVDDLTMRRAVADSSAVSGRAPVMWIGALGPQF
jgi:hypothetical protein